MPTSTLTAVERAYTNNCTSHYKFEGKGRDAETGNDYFGARYYSNRYGRWFSADWSAVPVAVPYANLTNPQTPNLYSMVADDPESFADLDGHCPDGPSCILQVLEVVSRFADNPVGFTMSFLTGAGKQALTNSYENNMRIGVRLPPANDVERAGAAVFNSSTSVAAAAAVVGGVAVEPYEVGAYGELNSRSVIGDGLTLDHIPSNASNIERAEALVRR